MDHPRIHLFVDAKCPALLKGHLTQWAKPGSLLAVIGPNDDQYAPEDAEEVATIRQQRSSYRNPLAEVHIIVEGKLSSSLLIGLGESVLDIIYIKDEDDSEATYQIAETIKDGQRVLRAYESLVDCNEAFLQQFNLVTEELDYDPDLEIDVWDYLKDGWESTLRQSLAMLADHFVESNKALIKDQLSQTPRKVA